MVNPKICQHSMFFVFTILLTSILLSGLSTTCSVRSVEAQTGLITTISSDTTWTKADSPHELTGPILVNQGITLTIEAGATVNLNGYEMRVNGTLRAIGTIANRIYFNDGKIVFTEYSNGWNEQTGTGSSIQFAIFDDVELVKNVPVSVNDNPLGEDDVWTIEDSPIDLSGQLVVDSGKVLTIEAGVTVNIHDYDLVVKGTLRVYGNSSDKVHFNGAADLAKIIFTENSNGWNKETGSGSIIEHAVLTKVDIVSDVSLKIVNSEIEGAVTVGGSSVIVGNTIQQLSISDGSVIVTQNDIGGITRCFGSPEITENTIEAVTGFGGSPVFSRNTIERIGRLEPTQDEIKVHFFRADSLEITDNVINRGVYAICGSGTVSYNTISGFNQSYTYRVYDYDLHSGLYYQFYPPPEITDYFLSDGIVLKGDADVSGNVIYGCNTGISGGTLIQGNLLVNNYNGIMVTEDNAVIRGNNVTNSETGIFLEAYAEIQNNTVSDVETAIWLNSSAKIHYNNIENYSGNSIYLDVNSGDVDATNNWWGTTDTEAISLAIYDSKYSFEAGTVSFTPLLPEPNPEATPNEIPEFPAWLVLPMFLVATLVVSFYKKRMEKMEAV